MTSGRRLARAVYNAAVRPAGPEPMITTLRIVMRLQNGRMAGRQDLDGEDLRSCHSAILPSCNLEMLVDDLLQVILLGEADDGFDDLSAFEEEQGRDAANLEFE